MEDTEFIQQRVLGTNATDFLMTAENAELFAWYGQAVALAQLLEITLMSYISALPPSSKARRRNPDKHTTFLKHLDGETLGELRQHIERFAQLKGAAADLAGLNDLRIELVHMWFREAGRAEKMATREGRGELVAELRAVADRLGTTVAALSTNALLIFGHRWNPAEAPPRRGRPP